MPFDRLIDNIKAKNNPTVAGLDPKLSYLPAYLKENLSELRKNSGGSRRGYFGVQ